MTREEAIEVYNGLINTKIKEAFEFFAPELRESEDERINRAIFKALSKKDARDVLLAEGIQVSDALTYLEKLKKEPCVYDEKNYHQAKKESWNSYEPMKEKFSTEELFYKGFYEGYQFGVHEEKPHTWTIHDEAVRKEAITCLQEWGKNFPINGVDYSNILYWLKEELSVHTVKPAEKPAEWSDTNELVFKDICKHLKEEGYNGWIVLLNALRNGEFQPKQEWSKEDKEMVQFYLDYADYKLGCWPNTKVIEMRKKFRNWLKSLPERLQLKPS